MSARVLLRRTAWLSAPPAAAAVALSAFLLGWHYGSLGIAAYDDLQRPLPLCSRFHVAVGLPLAVAAAAGVAALGRRFAWLVAGAGVVALAAGVAWMWALNQLRHFDSAVLPLNAAVVLAGGGLLAGCSFAARDARAAWAGVGLAVALAAASAALTIQRTAPLRTVEAGALAHVRLHASIASDYQAGLPCDRYPRPGRLVRWRGYPLCVPLAPDVTIAAGDVRRAVARRGCAAALPGLELELAPAAAARLNRLLGATGLRLVMTNAAGEVVHYSTIGGPCPGTTFAVGRGAWEETLGTVLGPVPAR